MDRSAHLEELGVRVVQLPFELHPGIPAGGVVRPRTASAYSRVAAECQAAGLPFEPPTRVPNTRIALETAELVRRHFPAAFESLNRALFDAHFVHGDDIGDDQEVELLVGRSGADPEEVRRLRNAGEGRRVLEESMASAAELDVTGTPAWLLAGSLLIPGAQPRELFDRVVARLASRQQ